MLQCCHKILTIGAHYNEILSFINQNNMLQLSNCRYISQDFHIHSCCISALYTPSSSGITDTHQNDQIICYLAVQQSNTLCTCRRYFDVALCSLILGNGNNKTKLPLAYFHFNHYLHSGQVLFQNKITFDFAFNLDKGGKFLCLEMFRLSDINQ